MFIAETVVEMGKALWKHEGGGRALTPAEIQELLQAEVDKYCESHVNLLLGIPSALFCENVLH